MKFIVVVAFTALLAVGQSAKLHLKDNARQARILEDEIQSILSCVQDIAHTGLPDLGLPVLDPLVIDDKVINLGLINTSLADGTLHIQNGQAKGLAGWRFENLKVSLVLLPPGVKVDFNLVNDVIDVSGDYDLDATVLGNPHSGKGSVSSVLGQQSLKGNVKISLSKGVETLDVGLTIGEVNFKITGVNNDEELSQKITDLINDNLNDLLVEHKDHINQIIKDLLNTILGKNKHAKDLDVNAIIQEILARCLPSKK